MFPFSCFRFSVVASFVSLFRAASIQETMTNKNKRSSNKKVKATAAEADSAIPKKVQEHEIKAMKEGAFKPKNFTKAQLATMIMLSVGTNLYLLATRARIYGLQIARWSLARGA